VKSCLASTLSFVQKLQKLIPMTVIGPHLAIIEVERQHRLNGNTSGRKLMKALENYFRMSIWVHLLSVCVHLDSIYTLYYVQD
jgi:hypothetical protein